MDPLTVGLITGGANLLGSIFSSSTSASNTAGQIEAQRMAQLQSQQFNAEQAGINREWSAGQAQIGREFQERMSNTAYQRASRDMQAAGLNPMMMFGKGDAASSPAGMIGSSTAASTSTPSVPPFQNRSPVADIGDAVGKALNSAITAKTYDKLTEEIAAKNAEIGKTKAEEALRLQQTSTERHRTDTEISEAQRREAESRLAGLKIPGAQFSARQAQELNKLPDWAVNAAETGKYAGNAVKKTIEPLVELTQSALKAHGLKLWRDRFGW